MKSEWMKKSSQFIHWNDGEGVVSKLRNTQPDMVLFRGITKKDSFFNHRNSKSSSSVK
jgi:hypothetical protein